MHAPRTWFVALFVTCILITREGRAEGSTAANQSDQTRDADTSRDEDTQAAYERAAKLGFEEFELGNYAEARARFLEAEGVYSNARILRALAMVEYELRRYPASIAFAERALASTERPLRTTQREDTERLLSMARGYVARYTITLVPKSARLTLDGSEVALGPGGVLFVPVGSHTFEARAPSHRPLSRAIHVLGPGDATLSLILSRRPAEAEVEAEETPLRRKWWLWTGLGVLAAGAAAGLVLGLRERGDAQLGTTSGAVITVPVAPAVGP